MLCGVVKLHVIDTLQLGSLRHGDSTFSGYAIGTAREQEDKYEFQVQFTAAHGEFSPLTLDLNHSVMGEMRVATANKESAGHKYPCSSESREILTLLPVKSETMRKGLESMEKEIKGVGLMQYLRNFHLHPIEIIYEFEHCKTRHILKRIRFTIPTQLLKETGKTILSLESLALFDLACSDTSSPDEKVESLDSNEIK